jgi:hypothetical protein
VLELDVNTSVDVWWGTIDALRDMNNIQRRTAGNGGRRSGHAGVEVEKDVSSPIRCQNPSQSRDQLSEQYSATLLMRSPTRIPEPEHDSR